jgi:hypothetical protein
MRSGTANENSSRLGRVPRLHPAPAALAMRARPSVSAHLTKAHIDRERRVLFVGSAMFLAVPRSDLMIQNLRQSDLIVAPQLTPEHA